MGQVLTEYPLTKKYCFKNIFIYKILNHRPSLSNLFDTNLFHIKKDIQIRRAKIIDTSSLDTILKEVVSSMSSKVSQGVFK